MNTVKTLAAKQLIKCPPFLPEAIQYEVIMGSFAYGVSSDTSDVDVYGFCVPDKKMVFPHLNGEIEGFGRQKQRFEQWQQHHVKDDGALGNTGREYDFQIYSIVKYFQLCMENNPNCLDSLFVPQRCILTMTPIGNMVRENRRMFLHKNAWHKFKGYAYSQMTKLQTKDLTADLEEIARFESEYMNRKYTAEEIQAEFEYRQLNPDDGNDEQPDGGGFLLRDLPYDLFLKYADMILHHGSSRLEKNRSIGAQYDCKFAYHIVRLINEVEQIMSEGDLDLERNNEQLKSIRRGEWKLEQIVEYFQFKEKDLRNLIYELQEDPSWTRRSKDQVTSI